MLDDPGLEQRLSEERVMVSRGAVVLDVVAALRFEVDEEEGVAERVRFDGGLVPRGSLLAGENGLDRAANCVGLVGDDLCRALAQLVFARP